MTHGFKIIDDMVDGLARYLDSRQIESVDQAVGKAVPSLTDWQYLNLNYTAKAQIDQDLCIQCGRCHIACEDASHQAISATRNGSRHYEVIEKECVGCNLCVTVCPVEDCLTLRTLDNEIDQRTNQMIRTDDKINWTTHPNNPMATCGK
jgi:dihydropyrimidine dehydrogenase (NAD+) subunit PreA